MIWGALNIHIDLGWSGLVLLYVPMVLGGLLGPIVVYFAGGIERSFGWVFGGKATHLEVTTVLAWTVIPSAISAALWTSLDTAAWIMTGELYADAPLHTLLDSAAFVIQLLTLALAIWSAVIWLVCFAEVNHFSIWRAMAATLLPPFVIGMCAVSLFLFAWMNS